MGRRLYLAEWRERRGLTQQQLADRLESPEASTSPAVRTYHFVDLRFFAVDGGIGAKQWSFHGAAHAI
jgi:hypothetical protein